MAEITARQVQELRRRTGAGMMDCKKALAESGGELESAVDWLRKHNLAAAAKKAGRVASEGLIGVVTRAGQGAVIEINSETDFVERNQTFRDFVKACAQLALDVDGDLERLKSAQYPDAGHSVEDELTQKIAVIKENLQLGRTAALSVKQGVVASYVHSKVEDNLGKIGVLVALESAADAAALSALGKQLAMHVAAASPQAVDSSDVDQSAVDREREVLAEQARASGKPEEIVAKMVEGRLRKYYEEVCLLEQTFVIDGETKVRKVLENASKDLGSDVKVAGFVRYQVGEGIEGN